MPKYQIYFDTVRGERTYNVDVDDSEVLDNVLPDILSELGERGDLLRGDGEPQVTWSGQTLEFNLPLPHQGVRPNDILRVTTMANNG